MSNMKAERSNGNSDTADSQGGSYDTDQQSTTSIESEVPTSFGSSMLKQRTFMKLEQQCSQCKEPLSLQEWHWTNAHTVAAWEHKAPRKAEFVHYSCTSLPDDFEMAKIDGLKRTLSQLGVVLPETNSIESGRKESDSGVNMHSYVEDLAKELDLIGASQVAWFVRQAGTRLSDNDSAIAGIKSRFRQHVQNISWSTRTSSEKGHDLNLRKLPVSVECVWGKCPKPNITVDKTGMVLAHRPGLVPSKKDEDYFSQLHRKCYDKMREKQGLELDSDEYII